MLGADDDWGASNVGLSIGHIQAGASTNAPGDSKLSADLWQVGGYVSAPIGASGRVGALLGYTSGPVNFTTPSILGRTTGKANAHLVTAEAGGLWNVNLGNASTLTPIAILDTVSGNLGGLTESGLGPLRQVVPSQGVGMADARLLVRYAHGWNANGIGWSVSGSAGVRQILFQPSGKLSVSFAGIIGQDFLVQGAATDRSAALLDFGLSANVTPRLSLQFGYEGSFSGNSQSNALHAELIGRF
jgi:outer membrane autotransporter protein